MPGYTADTFDGVAQADEATAILAQARELFARLDRLDESARMDTVNALRLALHRHSPMSGEPVDCVLWVPAEQVHGNDYNPNEVAPPEMKLLTLSIEADGFTQPIVAWPVGEPGQDAYEVVDGFHRHKVGKDNNKIRKRLHGRLPVAVIRPDRTELADRQAATVRHNRARGVHTVEGMSEIVVELARRGKSDAWIARELGMDADEITRLRQTTGIAELFVDQEFSEAWEAANGGWVPRPPELGEEG